MRQKMDCFAPLAMTNDHRLTSGTHACDPAFALARVMIRICVVD
jgi:hypothetical protein